MTNERKENILSESGTQAIPAVCEGIDVVGQAQTGTGKTAAYTIPMLMKIDPQIKKPQAIVLCPTRELAVQVAEEIRKLAKYMSDIKVLPVYGGQEIVRQIKSLKTGVQIIVGTPGRVMDHMRRKTVKFDNINMVILDEADEMLDMGFREDMETILTETPEAALPGLPAVHRLHRRAEYCRRAAAWPAFCSCQRPAAGGVGLWLGAPGGRRAAGRHPFELYRKIKEILL